MDSEFSKPKVPRAVPASASNQARASVEAHLQGRMPLRQQSSATLHAKMVTTRLHGTGRGQNKPAASNVPERFFSRENPARNKSPGQEVPSPGTSASSLESQNGAGGLAAVAEVGASEVRASAGLTGSAGLQSAGSRESSSDTSQAVRVPALSHVGPCKNPQCASCGTVIIPLPKATYPIQEQPSISINDWSIFTVKGPICLSDELDNLNETRYDFPLPEMIFGKNSVRLLHEKTGAQIEFNTLDALDSLALCADYKVAYYKEWLSTRPKAERKENEGNDEVEKKEGCLSEGKNEELPLESVKPYDWTYSTNYTGTLKNLVFSETDEAIPLEKLVRPDPILFFDESILFEDELGDNGISMYLTKVRVMGTCLLLLCRFSMRIDDVAFRIRDTRVYVDFDTGLIMREYKCQEASYEELLGKVSGRSLDPKKLLRDSNWVSQNTPVISKTVEKGVINGT